MSLETGVVATHEPADLKVLTADYTIQYTVYIITCMQMSYLYAQHKSLLLTCSRVISTVSVRMMAPVSAST